MEFSELIVKKVGRREWELVKDLVWYYSGTCKIITPAGFKTDFASIPRLFWWLFPPDGKYTPAAVVHDYPYKHGFIIIKKTNGKLIKTNINKQEADNLFNVALERLDVPNWKRRIFYQAVKWFGRYRH